MVTTCTSSIRRSGTERDRNDHAHLVGALGQMREAVGAGLVHRGSVKQVRRGHGLRLAGVEPRIVVEIQVHGDVGEPTFAGVPRSVLVGIGEHRAPDRGILELLVPEIEAREIVAVPQGDRSHARAGAVDASRSWHCSMIVTVPGSNPVNEYEPSAAESGLRISAESRIPLS